MHQREIFTTRHSGDDESAGESGPPEDKAAIANDIDELLIIDERYGGPDEDERLWLIEAQTFMRRQHSLQCARAKRDAVQEIIRGDRYMLRAANQLVKALKSSLKGL